MTVDPESRQLQSCSHGRDKEALRLRSEQTGKRYTHHDSKTGTTSKVVTEADGPPPLHKDADLLYRNQAEAGDTLTRGSLLDVPRGMIQTLIVAAGTEPQNLSRIALAGIDQIDLLAADVSVRAIAGALTRNLFMPNQKEVSVTTEKPLMTQEAHAARNGSHMMTQCLISMMCQEAAGCVVSSAVTPPQPCMSGPVMVSAVTCHPASVGSALVSVWP